MDKTETKTPKLKVIEGNLLIDPLEAGGEFVCAEITDTRLMGVVGLHVERTQGGTPFHQFFYLDTEEYGFDDYQSFLGAEKDLIDTKKSELFGALGGEWKPISEKEYLFLVKHYSKINQKYKLPLPEGREEYECILKTPLTLSSDEKSTLWDKMCSKITNDYELINYFIMRMVACDREGVSRLSTPISTIRGFKIEHPGSLLKNEIKPLSTNQFLCVSLIDVDKSFQLIESEISLLDGKVVSFQADKPMNISTWETSLILNKPEYVVHAQMTPTKHSVETKGQNENGDEEDFSLIMHSLFETMTESIYDFGRLYMIFRKNNEHVKKKIYRLDQDTVGVVCQIYGGELVFSGNDPLYLGAIENSITNETKLKNIDIEILGRYKFPEPVVIRFVDSDFDTFKDFLEYLQSFQK